VLNSQTCTLAVAVTAVRFYCEDALEVVNFKLSPLPAYFIPEPGSLSSFKDYIATLPATDRCVQHLDDGTCMLPLTLST
jgi:hypothetical protein